MGRRKRELMSEEKKNIIGGLLEAEMDEHFGYGAYEHSDDPDYRNGKKTKKIHGNFGEAEIEVPQDRDGTFEPKIVKKASERHLRY